MEARAIKEYIYQNEKIELSKEIIIEFVEHICEDEDKIYIACSFGKDSIVLVDLVRQLYPSIPIVFSDTGLEYKGIYKLKEKYDNRTERKCL